MGLALFLAPAHGRVVDGELRSGTLCGTRHSAVAMG
jgi:hypothetical protein